MIFFLLGLTTLAGEQSPHAEMSPSPQPPDRKPATPDHLPLLRPWYETPWIIVPISHLVWVAAVIRTALVSPTDVFATVVSTAVPLLASGMVGYFGWRLTNAFRRRHVIEPLGERGLIGSSTADHWARPTARTVIVGAGLIVYAVLHVSSVDATLKAGRRLERPPAWADPSISSLYYGKTLVMTMALVAIFLSLLSFLHRALDVVRGHAVEGTLPRQATPEDQAWGWSPLRSYAGCIGIGALAAIALSVAYARVRMDPMLHVDTLLAIAACVTLVYHALAIGWRLHQGYVGTRLTAPDLPDAEDLTSFKTELAVAVTAALALLGITASTL